MKATQVPQDDLIPTTDIPLFDVKALIEGTLRQKVRFGPFTLIVTPINRKMLDSEIALSASGDDDKYTEALIRRAVVGWEGVAYDGKPWIFSYDKFKQLADNTPGMAAFVASIVFDFDAAVKAARAYNEKN